MVMSNTALAKKKPAATKSVGGVQRMAAGEFKAKCLRIMNEVKETGKPLVVTKRGEPMIEIFPSRSRNDKDSKSLIGRLEGVMKIVGDPDDLLKPVFPLEDYDMLK
jgi:prevent-host-death family protein